MKKRVLIFFLGGLFFLGLGWFLVPNFYHFRKDSTLSPKDKSILIKEGRASIESLDVPVAALLVYKGEILGKGHNTVNVSSNLGQHAEINALSDAFFRMGYDAFQKLNRDSLVLLTTFEPCLMCRGALLENNIKHIEFLKDKGWANTLQHQKKELMYHLRRKQLAGGWLQDSLFALHPGYKKPF